MSRLGVIEEQKPGRCQLCNAEAETRPYGPKGENVCFPCGMKNEPAAVRGFNKLVLGQGNA